MSFAGAMLVAMAIDAALGWPDALYRRIGHPVTWIGGLIAALEQRLNRGPARRLKGVLTALMVIGLTGGLAVLIAALLPGGWTGTLAAGVLAWPLVAIRSMHQHVAAVAAPLTSGDLPGARQAVSMIVGRDPARLDTAGVARAAVESLAENTSDGIVAPLFWGVVAGLPGIAAYKAINTLDS
ncbi:MAG: cobalamin biosynthesis protein, partial [Rhodobacteraceae bacterium]|nr:cobalamin biosynthesis protein [Paracoccaceae bacterium]